MTKRKKIIISAAVAVAIVGLVVGLSVHRDSGDRDITPSATSGPSLGTTLPVANLTNMVQGIEAQWQLPVLNTLGMSVNVSVEHEPPGRIANGYVAAPVEAAQWVSISPSVFELLNNKAKIVTVILCIPDDATVPDKWEFWITVFPEGQGNIVGGVASRCLVTMKK